MTRFGRKFNWIATLVVVLTLAVPWAVFADTITNTIDATPDSAAELVTINAGGSASVSYSMLVTNGTPSGDTNGCNGTGSAPAIVTLSVPAEVTASSTVLSFEGCPDTQSVNFSSTTPGTYTISVFSVTGGKADQTNRWETAPATFTLKVNAVSTPTTTTVSCPASVTYNGSAQTPCTATVTGTGGFSQSLTVNYSNNTNVGTATASASFAGDATHDPSSDSETFEIAKATSSVVVTCAAGPFYYTGAAITPCGATYSTSDGLSGTLPVSYANNVNVGTATASASYAGDANHEASSDSESFSILAWKLTGFYRPVDMSATWNTVKGGSTVPLKFNVYAGETELTDTAVVKSFAATPVACQGGSEDPVDFITTGGTSLRYDFTDGQFIQNWQTPKKAGSCYKVTMTTQDLSTIVAYFKLK